MKRWAWRLTVVMIVGIGLAWPLDAADPANCVLRPAQMPYHPGARWTTPNTPSCTPFFAAGDPLPTDYPPTETVTRLKPITSILQEPPPYRPISEPLVRPARPPINIDVPFPPDKPPVMPSDGSKIHLLTLVDSDAANVGKVHAAGADALVQLLRTGIRAERFGTTVRLGGADLAAETIYRTLDELPVKLGDTLVVYYAGPGDYDEMAMSFMLAPSRAPAKFVRDELRKRAVAKNARLTVLLTDPATNLAVREPANKPETPNPGEAGLERLFFTTRGLVDVHACSVGEFAATRGEFGGNFTLTFVQEFGRPTGTWADLLEGVKHETNRHYKRYRGEVLRAADQPAPVKTIYRNQESQVPAPLTPLDNLKPTGPTGALPVEMPVIALKLEPARSAEMRPAVLQLKVPAAASLWVNGRPTATTGAERTFESEPLPADRPQSIEVRMEVDNWVGVYQIHLVGGQTTRVELVR